MRALGLAVLLLVGCDVGRTVDRSGLTSFKVEIKCAGEYASDCPAIPDGGVATCPDSTLPENVLGQPFNPVLRTQDFYMVQVTAYDGDGKVKTDYSGVENVYIQFEGSVTPTRSPTIPPLSTVTLTNGYGCLGIALPPAFNNTNLWIEEPATYFADAGHRWASGSFTVGASQTIYRPAPLISDVAFTMDPVQETSALNNKHVIIDKGDHDQPIVVTYVSANYFTVTDLGAGDLGPDHAWGSLELYTYSQPYGVKVGSIVSHLNGSVQNFLGLPELNFPVWNVDRYEPDPVLAAIPSPHRILRNDLVTFIPNMAAYKSGLVEIRSDTNEQWLICALNGPALSSYYKYNEWVVTTKQHVDCSGATFSMDIVSNTGVPDFNALDHAGKKICRLSGILTVVVPTPRINLWTITPRNPDDFSTDATNIVDLNTPCPP
jgi:hypothetical protein